MNNTINVTRLRPVPGRVERVMLAFEALPAALILLDGSGRVSDHNPAAARLFGEPLAGERWGELIAARFAPAPACGPDLELRDGRIVRLSTGPLAGDAGQWLLFDEVTEQRRLEERLAGQQRLIDMGRMAATLAHQIRTPLSGALLYVSHLAADSLPEAQRQRFAGKALDSLRALERLVADMLAYARAESAGDAQWIQAEELLLAVRTTLEPLLAATATDCVVAAFAGDRLLHANPALLESALQNLVVNAVQAMGNGGRLRLATRSGPDCTVDLICADSGPGIAPALRERIFEPFVTTRADGTGLGLAVVRTIARAHGGEVWAEENPGGGSRFILRLPAVDAPAAQVRAAG